MHKPRLIDKCPVCGGKNIIQSYTPIQMNSFIGECTSKDGSYCENCGVMFAYNSDLEITDDKQ